MTNSQDLLSIGQFSTLSRLSIRMLRHYDANGILAPAEIDPWTGYRRYAPSQLADATVIRDLRDAGFGVSTIGELLDGRGTPSWDEALEAQRRALIEEARANERRLELVSRLLSPPSEIGSITITKETVPAMNVVVLRGVVPSYEDERILWGQMMPAAAALGISPVGPCGVIEHNDEYRESDVDLSIFIPVQQGTTAEDPLEILNLPERECAVATVRGAYNQFSLAHDLIADKIVEDDLRLPESSSIDGHAFNIYVTEMGEVSEDELITKIYQPLGT